MLTGYIGTYSSPESKGVYRFFFDADTGALRGPDLFYPAKNAKWVSLHDDRLAIPIEDHLGAGTCLLRISPDGISPADDLQHISEVISEHDTPCNIAQADDYIFTANYHDGTVMIYRVGPEGLTVDERIECGDEAGCHQIILHNQYLMVPCLQQHKIRVFDRSDSYAEVGEITFPPGSGPRHGIFNRAHTKFYVVTEWSNQLYVFEVGPEGGGGFDQLNSRVPGGSRSESLGWNRPPVQVLDLLPDGAGDYATRNGPDTSAASAAIRLSKDERFAYVSIRFRDLLVVIDVTGDEARIIQRVNCGGEHPRDFILSPDERFIIVANRTDGGIVSLERDGDTGLIGDVVDRIPLAEAVSLTLDTSSCGVSGG